MRHYIIPTLFLTNVCCRKKVELVVHNEDVIVQDIAVTTVPVNDKWKVIVKVNCSGPLHATSDIAGKIYVSIVVEKNVNLSSNTDILLPATSPVRSIVATLNIFVPKVIPSIF